MQCSLQQLDRQAHSALDNIVVEQAAKIPIDQLQNLQEPALASRIAGEALSAITETFYEPALVNFKPSLVAAAVLYLSRRKVGASPFWPQSLSTLTGKSLLNGNFFEHSKISCAGDLKEINWLPTL